MKHFLLFAVCALSGALSAAAQDGPARAPATSEPMQTGLVLTKLSPPVYPPMARQARIMGDVKVYVHVRKDGGVESVELFSGHPVLTSAAIESAKKSTFECRGCDGVAELSLTYTFTIGNECHNTPDCSVVEERPPEVWQSPGHVVLTVDPWCTCDPAVTITRLHWRSAKCLYLWRCASRIIDSQ